MNLAVQWLRRLVASMGFIGYIPPMPGTLASALTVLALWFVSHHHVGRFLGPGFVLYHWVVLMALTAVSFYVCNGAREVFGREDPPQAVFDELVGQLFTFFMVPLSLSTLVLGFVLFRFYDIVKPYPAHLFESLEGGAGVTMDDVAAGVLSNLSIFACLWIYHGLHAFLYR